MPAIFQSDLWCDDCADKIRESLDNGSYDDETTYDSDEYPKYASDDEESDSPCHCAAGEDCVNAIDCGDGHKIGDWLGNPLTTDGEDYVKEAVREGGPVAELWADYYDYIDFAYSREEAADAGYIELLVDDHHGVYIPQVFCNNYLNDSVIYDDADGPGWRGIIEDDVKTLRTGPDHEWYWDTWDDVTRDAEYTDRDGHKWCIINDDGGAYAVRTDVEIDWEK